LPFPNVPGLGSDGILGGLKSADAWPETDAPQIDPVSSAGIPRPYKEDIFIPGDAGEEIRSKRELSALKYRLESAVKAEDFESAAALRDRIREKEGK
jgi:hypothetical protein